MTWPVADGPGNRLVIGIDNPEKSVSEESEADKIPSRNRIWIGVILICAPIVLTIIQAALPGDVARWYSDIIVPLVLGIDLFLGFMVLRTLADPEYQKFGFLFSALVGLWFSAETLFAVFDVIYGEPPEVSVADLLFLAGYIPPIAYFTTTLLERKNLITPATMLLTLVVWGGAAAGTLQVLLSVGTLSGSSPLSYIVQILYPILDLLLFLFLLLILPVWKKLGFRAYWAFMFVALCSVAVADILYFYQRSANTYGSGGVTDAMYLLGYAMLASGFVYILIEIKPVVPVTKATEREPVRSKSQSTVHIPSGSIYLIPAANPDSYFELFVREIHAGRHGVCITRTMPGALRKKHEIGNTPIFWLSHHSSPESIDPFRLELIASTLQDQMKRSTNLMIWVDGIEYLVTQNGFMNVLKWIQRMRDQMAVHDASMVVALDPQAFDSKELTLLGRETGTLPEGWDK